MLQWHPLHYLACSNMPSTTSHSIIPAQVILWTRLHISRDRRIIGTRAGIILSQSQRYRERVSTTQDCL